MNTQDVGKESARTRFYKKFSGEEQEFPHRIRRCYMTGKQCIFCSPQVTTNATLRDHETDRGSLMSFSVFVVMPFQPNFGTFYEWSLKRYLRDGLEIEEPDKQIRRADEFCDIGYIMCEKICRRIQEADLVVVDLSADNPNVMYEMGLAVGLHKPLLIMCNQSDRGRLSQEFLESVGLKDDKRNFKIVTYPGVGFLGQEGCDPVEASDRVPLMPRKAEMKIVPLIVAAKDTSNTDGKKEGGEKSTFKRDIGVTFSEALRGAVGVATKEISETKASLPNLQEAIAILKPKGVEELGKITEVDEINIVGKKSGRLKQFKDVARAVDSAFTCIIDLAGEDPHSYFWLGYCHARGINAIPIYREFPQKKSASDKNISSLEEQYPQKTEGNLNDKDRAEHVIAFDIRALWYIRFRHDQTKELAVAIRSALEELIAKDIPRLQRNIFWERLTRDPKIHIYTGAVHHEKLKREVVGDWDQRTVSELVRYLSSAEVSVIPELERPIYSPGTIKFKLGPGSFERSHLDAYISLVKSELTDKNCIIVASADVNPLTEVVLAHAYGVPDACFNKPNQYEIVDSRKNKIVVALKGWKNKSSADDTNSPTDEQQGDTTFPTFFSRPGRNEKLKEGYRGFLVGLTSKPLQKRYKSQDEVSSRIKSSNPDDQKEEEEEGFSLLSHLVVMQNPFWKKNKDAIIVLLNGVSGPGTFGLAEVLTGGKSTQKALVSEKLLKDLNLKWADGESDREKKRFGIEAIIEVRIKPMKEVPAPLDEEKTDHNKDHVSDVNAQGIEEARRTVHDKFYDLREVVEWYFHENSELMEKNPRNFDMPDQSYV
jgi:hypothetical protein